MRTSADAVVAAGVRFKSNKFTRSITIFNTGNTFIFLHLNRNMQVSLEITYYRTETGQESA